MATAAEITVQARIQQRVVNSALVEMRGYWASLDLSKPEAARDALLEFMPYLNEKYGTAAGSAAATFYDELRDVAGVKGRYRATVLAFDPEPTVTATRRIAGELFGADPQSALTGLAAMAGKQILDIGRNTTATSAISDPRSPGWHREIRGDTCPFCRMLATRGAVYKEATADFAAHHDCDCVALPSFDANAPEVSALQYTASRRTASMTPEQKSAHRKIVAGYVEDFKD